MTLLTIYTPTFRRPQQLARCRASVAAQTDGDYQHIIVEDHIGLGVAGMFRDIPTHYAHIAGEWVYFLSDDDVLTDPNVIADFRAQAFDADVVMAKSTIGEYTFPLAHCWRAEPREAGVTLSNWIVRREVWCSVPYGHRYEGDFDHIAECWRRGLRFAWWDRVICHAEGWGRGRPE
jgi:hypothetical protein